MVCKRCGLDVNPITLDSGILNNVYRCPKCGREFGGPTALKQGIGIAAKVGNLMLTFGLGSDYLSDGELDGNFTDDDSF